MHLCAFSVQCPLEDETRMLLWLIPRVVGLAKYIDANNDGFVKEQYMALRTALNHEISMKKWV